ncbi:unnamed protein product [Calypogeia fissa]
MASNTLTVALVILLTFIIAFDNADAQKCSGPATLDRKYVLKRQLQLPALTSLPGVKRGPMYTVKQGTFEIAYADLLLSFMNRTPNEILVEVKKIVDAVGRTVAKCCKKEGECQGGSEQIQQNVEVSYRATESAVCMEQANMEHDHMHNLVKSFKNVQLDTHGGGGWPKEVKSHTNAETVKEEGTAFLLVGAVKGTLAVHHTQADAAAQKIVDLCCQTKDKCVAGYAYVLELATEVGPSRTSTSTMAQGREGDAAPNEGKVGAKERKMEVPLSNLAVVMIRKIMSTKTPTKPKK